MPATLTQTLNNIASAIRGRGVSGTMTPAQMSAKMNQVQNGNKYGVHIDGILGSIDENGVVHQAANDTMIDIYAPTIRQIPQGVMDNERGFPGNTNIRSVSMPNLTTVGVSALQRCFRNCSNLVSVDFSGLTSIPDGTSSTGTFLYAFSGCTSLQTVDFSSLQSVGNYGLFHAFGEDTNITNIAAIGATASACSSLKNVDLSSLQSIGSSGMGYAFAGCSSLESIDLSSLTTLGQSALAYAFQNCTSLAAVDLSGLTTISSTKALNRTFSGCSGLASVDLSNLTTISTDDAITYLFQNCTSLKRMDLSSLTSISATTAFANVFNGCTSLEYVDLSNMETTATGTFGRNMFNGCTNLKVVRLTKLMKSGISLTYTAFQGCTSLEVVDFSKASGVPTLATSSGNHAFSSAGSIYRIVVPDSLYDTWIATTGWSTIASHIVKSSEFYTSQIEYLESIDNSALINAGLPIDDNNYKIVIDMQSTATQAAWKRYTGTYTSESAMATRLINYNTTTDSVYAGYRRTANSQNRIYVAPGTRRKYTLSYKKLSVDTNGTITNYTLNDVAGGADTSNLGIFGAKMKCWGLQVYHNDVLVRDMMPVRVGDEGCMYDKVNGVIYHNAGSSSFNVGEDTYVANTPPQ